MISGIGCDALVRVGLAIGLVFGITGSGAAQSVSGAVTDQLGRAVPAAVVTLRDAAGVIQAEASTDSEGNFQLVVPRSGEYRLVADALGHLQTESLLFAMTTDGDYALDIEIQTARSLGVRRDAPEARYAEWVRSRTSDWRTRDLIVVSGQEWRDIAIGRDMVEALRLAGFPRLTLRRTPEGFCAHSGAAAECLDVVVVAHGAPPRLRDIGTGEIDGVVHVSRGSRPGPRVGAMGPWQNRSHETLLLFMRGYFTDPSR